MIEWLQQENPALQQELDELVRKLPGQSPYLLSSWRNAVQQSYGFSPGVLVWREQNEIRGFLPYCCVRDILGRCAFVSLPYCDVGGPVAINAEIAEALVGFFAVHVCTQKPKGGEVRQQQVQQQNRQENQKNNAAERNESFLSGKKVNMQLCLPDNESALLTAFSAKLRSQIKKASKNGLTAKVLTDASGLEDFYKVYSQNMHRLGSPAHSKAWFAAVLQHYQANNEAILALVCLDKQVVGAAIVLLCNEEAVIPWASTIAEFNSLAPNMLLYWSVQAWLCQNGVRRFNFGRSTYGEGTYKFKKQWGAVPELLLWQRFNSAGQVTEQISVAAPGKLRTLAEQIWRTLPEPWMTSLGSRLRRYITL
ncbi:GNAT family N-acetyltransferase [Rheinheimera sp. UJ63]|uniref:GNAT family N-acetyltransferase n=1 Tax=Rheinheimera sp. UJ63 TaxID=2910157 RepID=UPI001F357766|nr:GNAT family N-acetyltransferase [Rheinheimera sp. UJ63]MCF4007811.1 GNAT family N-acetyltransferase [Rheinheimera sp. UJ63]